MVPTRLFSVLYSWQLKHLVKTSLDFEGGCYAALASRMIEIDLTQDDSSDVGAMSNKYRGNSAITLDSPVHICLLSSQSDRSTQHDNLDESDGVIFVDLTQSEPPESQPDQYLPQKLTEEDSTVARRPLFGDKESSSNQYNNAYDESNDTIYHDSAIALHSNSNLGIMTYDTYGNYNDTCENSHSGYSNERIYYNNDENMNTNTIEYDFLQSQNKGYEVLETFLNSDSNFSYTSNVTIDARKENNSQATKTKVDKEEVKRNKLVLKEKEKHDKENQKKMSQQERGVNKNDEIALIVDKNFGAPGKLGYELTEFYGLYETMSDVASSQRSLPESNSTAFYASFIADTAIIKNDSFGKLTSSSQNAGLIFWNHRRSIDGGKCNVGESLSKILKHVMLYIPSDYYLDMLMNGHENNTLFPLIDSFLLVLRHSLEEYSDQFVNVRVTLAVCGIDEEMVKIQKKWNDGTSHKSVEIGQDLLDDASAYIMLYHSMDLMRFKDKMDMFSYTRHVTRALLIDMYKNPETEYDDVFKHKIRKNEDFDKLDDNQQVVYNLREQWVNFLKSIPNLSDKMARNLVKEYSCPLKLIRMYQNPSLSRHEKEILLETKFGETRKQTKLSKQIYIIMTSTNPDESIEI